MKKGYFTPDSNRIDVNFFFKSNGYLVLEDGFTTEEINLLKQESVAICKGERGTLADGGSDEKLVIDQFMGEKHPEDIPLYKTDELALQKILCVHFPHKISKPVYEAVHNKNVVDVLTYVVGPNVKCMQSMLFIKASGKPGQAWHQDEDYIPTRDRSLIGAWVAIDDATIDNGCLWVLPESHKPGILWDQTWHGDRNYDCADLSVGFPYTDDQAVPVEVKAGSVVFFNGYLLHKSLPNKAPAGTFRRSLVNHYMSCESFLPWGKVPDDLAVARHNYKDVMIVAGVDPYAHHGYEDIQKPLLRPSGEGGCDKWGGTREYTK